jgi:hypothetical protein
MEYLKPSLDSRTASDLIQGGESGHLDVDKMTLIPNDFRVNLED